MGYIVRTPAKYVEYLRTCDREETQAEIDTLMEFVFECSEGNLDHLSERAKGILDRMT